MRESTVMVFVYIAIFAITLVIFIIPLRIEFNKTLGRMDAMQKLFIKNQIKFLEIPVAVTAYSADIEQTDNTPDVTASNRKVKPGFVALSRDIEEDFGLKFGDLVHLDGFGTFEFQDRMHKRKIRQVDIFMEGKKDAVQFGVKRTIMKIL